MNDGRSPGRFFLLSLLPVLLKDRPQHLIQIVSVTEEGVAENPFALGADLPERAITATVAQRRTRLESVRAEHVKREVEDEFRRLGEDPGTPEFRTQREAPVSRAESRPQRP